MRFLILTQYFPPEIGAAQTRLMAFAAALREKGHEVEVVTAMPNHLTNEIFQTYRGKWYCKEQVGGVVVHRTWIRPTKSPAVVDRLLNYFSFMLTSMFGLARAQRPDYLFVESPPLFVILPAYCYSWMRSVPIILNVSDLWPDAVKKLGVMHDGLMLRLGYALEAWAYRIAPYISTVSKGMIAALADDKKVPVGRLLLLPNGVDTKQFSPGPADAALAQRLGLQGKQIFLYAGTHGLAYNLELIVALAETLQHEGVAFLFVGDGIVKRQLIESVHRRHLKNVVFVDPQPIEDMMKFFSIACASLVPLRHNSLFEVARPAKIFPSMATGVPVVYCGEGEGANVIRRADAGIVIRSDSLSELRTAVLELARNPELRARYGANGRAYVLQNEDWSKIVQEWLAELEAHTHMTDMRV